MIYSSTTRAWTAIRWPLGRKSVFHLYHTELGLFYDIVVSRVLYPLQFRLSRLNIEGPARTSRDSVGSGVEPSVANSFRQNKV